MNRTRGLCIVIAIFGVACGGETDQTKNGDAGSDSSNDAAANDASSNDTSTDTQLAKFAFVVGGVAIPPMVCPSLNWEYAPTSAASVQIQNVGAVPIAYVARRSWTLGTHFVPGVSTGAPNELAGVLAPGAEVDITSVFAGGITALLGSAEAFSDGTKTVFDEGTISWPASVTNPTSATTMHVAQIDADGACGSITAVW